MTDQIGHGHWSDRETAQEAKIWCHLPFEGWAWGLAGEHGYTVRFWGPGKAIHEAIKVLPNLALLSLLVTRVKLLSPATQAGNALKGLHEHEFLQAAHASTMKLLP